MNRFGLSVTVVVLPMEKDEALWLAAPVTETEETIKEARWVLFGSSLTTLGLVLLLSWLLAEGLNRRIKTMRHLAQQVADGDFTKGVPVQGNDEIADLARDLNRMAEMLEEAKKEADRYDQARSRFLADISHELKTPLTSIRGLLEALRNHLVKGEDRERIYFLMEKETIRLIRLVQSVMELEKMRAGKMELKMEQFPFYPVLEDIVDQMNILAEEKDISLIIGGNPETLVYGNEDRLRQVAINLIKNALQFTNRGEIRITTWNEKGETWLTVADTGVGLTEDQSRDIFERFYKVDSSRATTTGEMGLGLSMVKQIVLSHGGEVRVESEPGKGSKFIIRLPLKK
ncbi:MAG TPA: sensor histidine kinase [Paenibacillaceae bacterium]|nr:sensor histidine kinase [Paenibacillaceae bacterium]